MTAVVHNHEDMLPRGALVLACSLVLFSLAVTTIVRVGHIAPSASPEALRAARHIAPIASRSLRFADRADGAVVITDVKSGGVAGMVEPGTKSGFIRGVMRGLARDRHMRGIGDQPPFTLTLWKDGELSLVDTATGRDIEVSAFGTTNRADFAALLPPAAGAPQKVAAR
jgi:putative photosynthetic complex assembly protein